MLVRSKSMKNSVLLFALASFLLLSISTLYVDVAKAQPLWIELGVPVEPFSTPPIIQIISPNQNQTFTSPNVLLNFSIMIPNSWVFYTGPVNDSIRQIWGNITSVSFSLDDNQLQNLTLDKVNTPYLGNSSQDLNFSAQLNLTEGAHSIEIFISGCTYYVLNPLESLQYNLQLANVPVEANTTVNFDVALPTPIIISPQNAIYNESTVPLQFNLGSSNSWIGYSLDGKANVTVTGNTTLTELSSGMHKITVYTNDTYGNMRASESVFFTITQPFPTVTVVAVLISVVTVVVVSGLLVYFKKHKRTIKSQTQTMMCHSKKF